jgi:hypothetical protein
MLRNIHELIMRMTQDRHIRVPKYHDAGIAQINLRSSTMWDPIAKSQIAMRVIDVDPPSGSP